MLLPVILSLMGCSASRMMSSADREVYEILSEKREEVTADRISWEIEPGEEEKIPSGPLFLSLKDALIVAAKNNYDYQKTKEDVYLEALSLTSERYEFRLRYGFGGESSWEKNSDGERVGGNLNFNLVKWLAQGAEINFEIRQDYEDYLTGDEEREFRAVVSLDLFQPLFRGAGREIAQEDLLQAEREMIYEIRSFLRYQRSFSVDVAEDYFALLESKNNLKNYRNNYVYLKETRQRIKMLSEAGRIPSFQVDQAEQDELKAYQRSIEASNSYQGLLDGFKIFLGFSPEIDISLDEKILENFLNYGIERIEVDPQQSMKLALERRLDLMTVRDEMEDSKRKVNVALNELRTRLDLCVNVYSSSTEKPDPTFDLQAPSYKVGLDLEFPLDNISERNSYRGALITLERKRRDLVLKEDEVKLEILNSYRDLQESYETYVIQKKSLGLGERRVESTDLLLQAGRATTRDLLEAQESYLDAKNSLASSIVSYWISYLDFLKDSESLELDEKGIWKGALYEKIGGENHQE